MCVDEPIRYNKLFKAHHLIAPPIQYKVPWFYDTPSFFSHGDEGLESWVPCDIFETQLFEEYYYEHEDELSKGFDANDKKSHI